MWVWYDSYLPDGKFLGVLDGNGTCSYSLKTSQRWYRYIALAYGLWGRSRALVPKTKSYIIMFEKAAAHYIMKAPGGGGCQVTSKQMVEDRRMISGRIPALAHCCLEEKEETGVQEGGRGRG